MIIVTVEIYPVGNFAKRQIVASALITNDGTGTYEEGNYQAKVIKDGEVIGKPKIMNFPRLKLDAWDLIGEVIKKRREQ